MRMWKPEDEDAEALSRDGVEVWSPVSEAPGRYFVSNLGSVASAAQTRGAPRLMTLTQMPSGYLSVGLVKSVGEKAAFRLVHKLVVQAFRGDKPTLEHTDVRHKDRNKTNNRLLNVVWGTRSENMLDVWEHRKTGTSGTPSEVRDHGMYVGDTNDVRLLTVGLELHREGKLNTADLARLWGCSDDVAFNIVHGKRKAHSAQTGAVPTKKYRSPEQKAAIATLVAEGKGFKEINEVLGESLTAQDVYYYRTRPGLKK
jgi:hypothetical protein